MCSDPNNATDLFVQPTSIGSSKTQALDSGERNLEGPGEVYYDYNEQSWNLLDLTLPPGDPQRLCSSFTLYYSTDLSPRHECRSEHLLLEDPYRRSEGQPARSESSLITSVEILTRSRRHGGPTRLNSAFTAGQIPRFLVRSLTQAFSRKKFKFW